MSTWHCPEEEGRRPLGRRAEEEVGEWGARSGPLGPVCGLLLSSSSWASRRGAGELGVSLGHSHTRVRLASVALLSTVPACPVQQRGGQSRPRRTPGSGLHSAPLLLASFCPSTPGGNGTREPRQGARGLDSWWQLAAGPSEALRGGLRGDLSPLPQRRGRSQGWPLHRSTYCHLCCCGFGFGVAWAGSSL